VKRLIITFLLLATVLTIGGCNHLPRGGAPREEMVFNRFDRVQLMQSSSNEVLSFIQDKSMAELLSQDEQTLVSWGQKNDGAVIWLNAVSFDSDSDAAARKYAVLIYEDSPGWKLFYGAKSEKIRAEFEFMLPPEFDEIEVTTENTRRREALKSALGLYLMDTNNIRHDSDYIFSASMLLRQTFNQLLYELERVPARLSEIDSLQGVAFTHPTLGEARVRMLFDTDTYIVRIKLKVGGVAKSFAKHKDVIAMGEPVVAQAGDYPQTIAEDERERRCCLLYRRLGSRTDLLLGI